MKRLAFLLVLFIFATSVSLIAAPEKEAEKKADEITFMIPPWGEPSSEALEDFTRQTGIKVNLNIVGWDEIRDKIAIAAISKTAPADVVEVDWSWVGEFYAAGWVEELEVSSEDKADMPTLTSFMADGKVLAIPYANDYRIGYYNTEDFKKASITTVPANWEEMVTAAKKLKASGVCQYPIGFTLSATEACTTSIIWMTMARSGNFFNEDGTLNSANLLETLQFIHQLAKVDKLIDPAMATMTDKEIYGLYLSGTVSTVVGPTYVLGRMDDPNQSSIVGKSKAMLVPGRSEARTTSFALPEGIGVTAYSANKEAANTFVTWYTSPETQLSLYETQGLIPTRNTVLQALIDDGKMTNGDVLIAQSEQIKPAFPAGIPIWYSEMSAVIYNSVNEMVTGNLSPAAAMERIQTKVEEISK
jgi:multiple sugar transport system substrate-binding protein